MAEGNGLHWSFNHDSARQTPYFAEQFFTAIKPNIGASRVGESADRVIDYYTVLPNFARGFKGSTGETKDGYDLKIGEVSINRNRDGADHWQYTVRSINTSSGEDLKLDYACRRDDYRTLVGDWKVKVENSAGDGYRQFACDGKLSSDGAVTLTVNGLDLEAGTVDLSKPLTCNWSLFDVIPALCSELKESGDRTDLTLLEDLEKIRPQARIGFMEDYSLPVGEESLELSGYYLYGEGTVPSYWWLDSNGKVVIVSSIFQTMIHTPEKAA